MVNKLAILGSLMGLICLFLPWWQYTASSMGLNVDRNINPWDGYGGSVGSLANAISGIDGGLASSGFNTLLGTLRLGGLLVAVGSFIGLGGALIRGNGGRGSVALAGILSLSGVVTFYSALIQGFSSVGLAATGSASPRVFGYSAGSADWGWTYGFFLGGLASLLLLTGVGTHPERRTIPAAQLRPIQPFISGPTWSRSSSDPVLAPMSTPGYAPAQQSQANLAAKVVAARCSRCGKMASERAMFCNRCGSRLGLLVVSWGLPMPSP